MRYERYIKEERIKIIIILGIGFLLSFLISFFIFYFLESISSFLTVFLNTEGLTLRPWSYILSIVSFLIFFLYWMMAFRISERLGKIKKLKG